MKYPAMGKNRQYRVTLPELNGGVNYAVPPHLIADNQLSDVKNMWYKDGRLQTRPGFVKVSSVENVDYEHDFYSIGNSVAYLGSKNMSHAFEMTWRMVDRDAAFSSEEWWTFEQNYSNEYIRPLVCTANSSLREGLSDFDALVFWPRYGLDGVLLGGNIRGFGTGGSYNEVKAYVPIICKGGTPCPVDSITPEAINFEPRNMLTPSFRCQYTTDGEGVVYVLPENKVYGSFIFEYTDKNGTVHTHEAFVYQGDTGIEVKTEKSDSYILYVDCVNGHLKLLEETPEGGYKDVVLPPATQGNNVTITVLKDNWNTENTEKIYNMRFSTWFGGGASSLTSGTRLFVSGNPKHPNLVHWSSLNDPTYFPETNYAYVGEDLQAVTGFGKQGELLVIFKEREIYCMQYLQGNTPTVKDLMAQDSIDVESAQAAFPMVQLHPEIGCDCPDTIKLCNNRLVWLNSDGRVYGLFTTGQYSERNVRALSYSIDDKLGAYTKETLKKASAAEYRDTYLLLIDNEIYTMDYSSSGFSYYSSYSSDEKSQKALAWYVWDVSSNERQNIRLINAGDSVILFGHIGYFLIASYVLKEKQKYDTVATVTYTDTGNGTTQETSFSESGAIHSCFQTKLFDFGYPERFKRINPFYLQITGAEGKTLELTYLNGNGGCTDGCAPMMTGADLEATTPMRITPNAVRVREFGFRVEYNGCIEVGSLTMNYAMMGMVR